MWKRCSLIIAIELFDSMFMIGQSIVEGRIKKKFNGVNEPLYLSISPEILVKMVH